MIGQQFLGRDMPPIKRKSSDRKARLVGEHGGIEKTDDYVPLDFLVLIVVAEHK